MMVEDAGGQTRTVHVRKEDWEPLGLTLDQTIVSKPRPCRNHCIFCFIDQMPPGMRKTLYVKDDDWRLSLMMGNYITMTNIDDHELDRIIRRKVSPLFVSVQCTDPDMRVKLLRNPNAAKSWTTCGFSRQTASASTRRWCSVPAGMTAKSSKIAGGSRNAAAGGAVHRPCANWADEVPRRAAVHQALQQANGSRPD